MKQYYFKGMFAGIFISLACVGLIGILGVSALAATGRMTIEVDPINVQVNGQLFQPMDAKGNSVPVFSYNGTTYAPLRAMAESFGLEVGYDSQTNMATVSGPNMATSPEATSFTLSSGKYIVGEDIPAGKYECTAVSGFGVLRGDVASLGAPGLVLTMGNSTSSIGDYSAAVEGAMSYSNLTLEDGDVIYIEMNLSIQFVRS